MGLDGLLVHQGRRHVMLKSRGDLIDTLEGGLIKGLQTTDTNLDRKWKNWGV